MKWGEYRLSAILSGSDGNGTKLFPLFLRDVRDKLGVKLPNASCQKCLKDYHLKLILLETKKVENMSKYRLLPKREGISLEFGSQILVTNDNLTDAYAQKLIKRFKALNKDFKMEDLFEAFPTKENKVIETEKVKAVKSIKKE